MISICPSQMIDGGVLDFLTSSNGLWCVVSGRAYCARYHGYGKPFIICPLKCQIWGRAIPSFGFYPSMYEYCHERKIYRGRRNFGLCHYDCIHNWLPYDWRL